MGKEQIYYGELIPVTGGEPVKLPAIVILSDDTEAPCILPENDIPADKQRENEG